MDFKDTTESLSVLMLLVQGRILKNHARWRRNLAKSPICDVCRDDLENNLHAIRDCPRVWLVS